MNKSFLELDLRMLIVRYGRRQVLQGLAGVLDATAEQIEAQLAEIERNRAQKKRPKIKAPENILDDVTRSAPTSREALRKLMALYESRVFLPDLRNVHAFLDRRGASKTFKSRKEGLTHVMHVLATLNDEELQSLIGSATSYQDGTSDYSMLANEILASPRRKAIGE